MYQRARPGLLILSNMDLQVSEYSSFDELESLCAVVVVVVVTPEFENNYV